MLKFYLTTVEKKFNLPLNDDTELMCIKLFPHFQVDQWYSEHIFFVWIKLFLSFSRQSVIFRAYIFPLDEIVSSVSKSFIDRFKAYLSSG